MMLYFRGCPWRTCAGVPTSKKKSVIFISTMGPALLINCGSAMAINDSWSTMGPAWDTRQWGQDAKWAPSLNERLVVTCDGVFHQFLSSPSPSFIAGPLIVFPGPTVGPILSSTLVNIK